MHDVEIDIAGCPGQDFVPGARLSSSGDYEFIYETVEQPVLVECIYFEFIGRLVGTGQALCIEVDGDFGARTFMQLSSQGLARFGGQSER